MRNAIALLGCLALLTPVAASAQEAVTQTGSPAGCYHISPSSNGNGNYNNHSCYDAGRAANNAYYPSTYQYVVVNPTDMTNTRDNRGDISGGGNTINPNSRVSDGSHY